MTVALTPGEFESEAKRAEANPATPQPPCMFCRKPTSAWRGLHRRHEDGAVSALCDLCALGYTAIFLRGRHEFDLAKRIEALFASAS